MAKGGISCGVCGHKHPASAEGWILPHVDKRTGTPCGHAVQRSADAEPTSLTAPAKHSRKKRSAKPAVSKKRPRIKAIQNYCPRCRAFVIMTKLDGTVTVTDHLTKRGARCVMSGKQFVPTSPKEIDALEYRVSGSFGTGKRR